MSHHEHDFGLVTVSAMSNRAHDESLDNDRFHTLHRLRRQLALHSVQRV